MRLIANRNRHNDYKLHSVDRGWHVFYQNLPALSAYRGFDDRALCAIVMGAISDGSIEYEIHGNCVMFQ